jgi:hypothetical protein
VKADSPTKGAQSEGAAGKIPKDTLWNFIGVEEDPAYQWVPFVFGLIAAANILSYFAETTSLSFLDASRSQPWGAITSIGLYDSWESTVALPLLALLWFLLNTRVLSPERRRRSLLLIIGSAYVAVLANVVWLFSKSPFEYTAGVSGFEVAAGGIMLVFTLTNLSSLRHHQVRSPIQLRATDKGGMRRLLSFVYVTLAMILVMTWVTLIELSGASINTEVHVVSLTIGIGMATVYEFMSASKKRSNSSGMRFAPLQSTRSPQASL